MISLSKHFYLPTFMVALLMFCMSCKPELPNMTSEELYGALRNGTTTPDPGVMMGLGMAMKDANKSAAADILFQAVASQESHSGFASWAKELLPAGIGSPDDYILCLLYTSPSPRDATLSRMPSSA